MAEGGGNGQSFTPGQTLGEHEIIRYLGAGETGEVYLAEDLWLRQNFVLKVLPREWTDREGFLERFGQAVEALGALKSDAIVAVHKSGQDQGRFYLAVDYVAGDTLEDYVLESGGRLDPEETLEIMRQVCAALSHAHEQGVTHGSLKPSNILRSANGKIRVTDFGLSLLKGEQPGAAEGRSLDLSPDIQAVGGIIFFLLTGRKPAEARQPPSSLAEGLHPQWDALTARCLAGDPAQRYPDIPSILQDLGKTAAPPPEEKPEPPPPPPEAPEPAPPPPEDKKTAEERIHDDQAGKGAPPPEPAPLKPPPRKRKPPEAGEKPAPVPESSRKGLYLLYAFAALAALLAGAGIFFYTRHQEQQAERTQTQLARQKEEEAARRRDRLRNQDQELWLARQRAEQARSEAEVLKEAERLLREKERQAKARGGARILTDPPGAAVKLGDNPPVKSPALFESLKLGKYPVEIQLEKYEPQTLEVEILEDQITEAGPVKLARRKGGARIVTTPAGAAFEAVSLQSEIPPRKGTTPQKLENLPTGEYEVIFRYKDWPEKRQSLKVEWNEETTVKEEFHTGGVVITSTPSGAEVYLSGSEEKLGETPLILDNLPPGPVMYELRKFGYETMPLGGIVLEQRQLPLSATLKKKGPKEGENWTVPDIGLEMVYIQPGIFVMGSPETEKDRGANEGPQTTVELTKGFWLGKFEVTQGEYTAITGTTIRQLRDRMGDFIGLNGVGQRHPVYWVAFGEALEFCRMITERERSAGRLPEGYVYTLPSEAQWEYACRAATATAYYFGNEADAISQYAWHLWNSENSTHPGGQKKPNRFGLYDMHGNVWEWCMDWYQEHYPGGKVKDWKAPPEVLSCVIRGGSWADGPEFCRSAARREAFTTLRFNYLGFRVALRPVN